MMLGCLAYNSAVSSFDVMDKFSGILLIKFLIKVVFPLPPLPLITMLQPAIIAFVKNSIISRYVTIGEGAVVENSIILTGTYIDAGAVVKNAVVDKYCHITSEGVVEGRMTSPVYLEQGTLIK